MSDRRTTRGTRSDGATLSVLVLTLFGTMGGAPAPPNLPAEAAPLGVYGPVSISTGVEVPRARALPSSGSFATAAQESQSGGGSPRPAAGSVPALALDSCHPPLPRVGLPPRAEAFGLRGLAAHPSTAPPQGRLDGRAK